MVIPNRVSTNYLDNCYHCISTEDSLFGCGFPLANILISKTKKKLLQQEEK